MAIAPNSTYAVPGREHFRLDSSGNLGFGLAAQNSILRAAEGVVTKYDAVRMEDLNSDAFNTPVETLINLWVTRFGNEWVELDRIEDDKFFFAAYKRLRSLGMLETHYLTDRSRFVCRKPE